MKSIEGDLRARKSMHKSDDLLSEKERLAYFDQTKAAIVGVVLAEDSDFQAKSQQIANGPSVERAEAARREAKTYAPNKTVAQELIADLLLLMAEEPWRAKRRDLFARRDFFFANRTLKAVWVEAPLDEPRWSTGSSTMGNA